MFSGTLNARRLGASVIIQALGTASTFLIVIIVARWGGPALQGYYAILKSWIDFGAVVAQFGFPQAFIFAINNRIAKRAVLVRWSSSYAIVIMFVALPASVLAVTLLLDEMSLSSVTLVSIVTATSIALATYHRLIRSVFLTFSDGIRFALFTIIPSIGLLVGVLIVLTLALRIELSFLFSFMLGAGAAMIVARRFRGKSKGAPFQLRSILKHSWMMFFHAVLVTAQPIVVYAICNRLGTSTGDIGLFSAATLPVLAAQAVCGMIAPILFNRFSKISNQLQVKHTVQSITKLTASAIVITVLGVALLPIFIPYVLGEDYVGGIKIMQVITLAIPAAVYTQVLTPLFFGLGSPKPVIIASIIRFCVIVSLLFALSLTGILPIEAAAWGWMIAEWAGAAYLFVKRPVFRSMLRSQ